jgi:predicted dehydrogenase
MIRVGLVGLGFIGRTHLACYTAAEKAGLVAVADLEVERLKQQTTGGSPDPRMSPLSIPHGIAHFATLDDMLKGVELDMVDICLPTFLHAQSTIAAAQAGKHILCEKPMALSVAECQAMIDAARANGVQLMIGQCLRFWPEYGYLKETHDSQRLGRLQSLTMRRLAAPPLWSWQSWLLDANRSGGTIVDLHIHDVDFINFLLGPPRAIFAQGIEQGITGGTDVVIGNFLYPGMKVAAEAGWIRAPGFRTHHSYEALFERGLVRMATDQPERLMVYEEGREPYAPQVSAEDGYTAEIKFFLECLSEGRDVATALPPESPMTSVRMALLEKESIARGEIVPFPPQRADRPASSPTNHTTS